MYVWFINKGVQHLYNIDIWRIMNTNTPLMSAYILAWYIIVVYYLLKSIIPCNNWIIVTHTSEYNMNQLINMLNRWSNSIYMYENAISTWKKAVISIQLLVLIRIFNDKNIHDLFNIFLNTGLLPTVTKPTCIMSNSATLIDNLDNQ